MSVVTITRDRAKAVTEAVQALTTTEVMVGIPSSSSGRNDGPLNNAEIGYIHEFGAPAANIPARPFLRPGIETIRAQIIARLRTAAVRAVEGDRTAVMNGLTAIGLLAQSAVRRKIQTGPFAPLKPSTLAARRARGRTGTRPLIDTGQLRNAINFVLRRK